MNFNKLNHVLDETLFNFRSVRWTNRTSVDNMNLGIFSIYIYATYKVKYNLLRVYKDFTLVV